MGLRNIPMGKLELIVQKFKEKYIWKIGLNQIR